MYHFFFFSHVFGSVLLKTHVKPPRAAVCPCPPPAPRGAPHEKEEPLLSMLALGFVTCTFH